MTTWSFVFLLNMGAVVYNVQQLILSHDATWLTALMVVINVGVLWHMARHRPGALTRADVERIVRGMKPISDEDVISVYPTSFAAAEAEARRHHMLLRRICPYCGSRDPAHTCDVHPQ